MSVRAVVAAVVASTVAALLSVGMAGAPPRDTTSGCDWGREFHRTLTGLGEHPDDWRIIDMQAKRPGVYAHALIDPGYVELGRHIPCRRVSSVIKHEWAHMQQGRMYGGGHAALKVYESPAVMEFAADCAALRLGATYSPYLDQGPKACDQSWPRAEAQRIISHR